MILSPSQRRALMALSFPGAEMATGDYATSPRIICLGRETLYVNRQLLHQLHDAGYIDAFPGPMKQGQSYSVWRISEAGRDALRGKVAA